MILHTLCFHVSLKFTIQLFYYVIEEFLEKKFKISKDGNPIQLEFWKKQTRNHTFQLLNGTKCFNITLKRKSLDVKTVYIWLLSVYTGCTNTEGLSSYSETFKIQIVT